MNYWQIVGHDGRPVADYLDESEAHAAVMRMNLRYQTDEYRVVPRRFDGDAGPVSAWWNGKRFEDHLPEWAEVRRGRRG